MKFFASSPAAKTALVYITAGSFVIVWTTVWLIYLSNNPPQTNVPYYWIGGFLATGVISLLIGFGLGRIGRAAHRAELPMKTEPPVIVPPVAAVAPKAEVPVTTEPPLISPTVSRAPAGTPTPTDAGVAPEAPTSRSFSDTAPPNHAGVR